MISHSDKEYIDTKQIKLGLSQMPKYLSRLADKVEARYGVRPLNIYCDHIQHNGRPRIQIIFERYTDKSSFMRKGIFPDRSKQKEIIELMGEIDEFSVQDIGENVHVLFKSFDIVAKQEVNGSITQAEIDELIKAFNSPEIWCIWKSFSSATVFFYTKEQVDRVSDSKLTKLTDAYYKLIKKHDQFDLFKRENFSIYLDDKERFDEVYKSNWFYYAKDH